MFWRKNPVTGFEPVADVRLIERWLPIADIGDGCLGTGASCGRLARPGHSRASGIHAFREHGRFSRLDLVGLRPPGSAGVPPAGGRRTTGAGWPARTRTPPTTKPWTRCRTPTRLPRWSGGRWPPKKRRTSNARSTASAARQQARLPGARARQAERSRLRADDGVHPVHRHHGLSAGGTAGEAGPQVPLGGVSVRKRYAGRPAPA